MYKVGDKIIIKNREYPEYDYPCTFVDDMLKYCSKIATITSIYKVSMSLEQQGKPLYDGDPQIYVIDLDEGSFMWTSSMFIEFTSNNFTNLQYYL